MEGFGIVGIGSERRVEWNVVPEQPFPSGVDFGFVVEIGLAKDLGEFVVVAQGGAGSIELEFLAIEGQALPREGEMGS